MQILKTAKTIFFIIMALIMILCTGILVCAMSPSLTKILAEKVAEITSEEPGENDALPEQPPGDGSKPSGTEDKTGSPGQTEPDAGSGSPDQTDALGKDSDSASEGMGGDPSGEDSPDGTPMPGISADWIRDGNQTDRKSVV